MITAKLDDKAVDDMIAKMAMLGDKYAKNATRRALNRGAAPIRDQARQNAAAVDDPLTPETIAKNIVIRNGRTRIKTDVKTRVGVLGGARNMEKYGEFTAGGKANPGGDTWYWRFLEFGTRMMSPRPFMRAAMMSEQVTAYNNIVAAMTTELNKEIAKRL